jgi:hypothetical protein
MKEIGLQPSTTRGAGRQGNRPERHPLHPARRTPAPGRTRGLRRRAFNCTGNPRHKASRPRRRRPARRNTPDPTADRTPGRSQTPRLSVETASKRATKVLASCWPSRERMIEGEGPPKHGLRGGKPLFHRFDLLASLSFSALPFTTIFSNAELLIGPPAPRNEEFEIIIMILVAMHRSD